MPAKSKNLTEVQFLALLDKVLGKVMSDLNLRTAIQEEVAREIRIINKLASFTKFAEKDSVPDGTPATVEELQSQLAATFGDDAKVAVTPAEEEGGSLGVEIVLPDRTVSSQVRVQPGGGEGEGGEPTAPFVPFPVTLPADPELVWVLGRRENLGPDEAARALASIEEEYWASKAGQQRLRKGAERNFAEFIESVPSAALLESGMKRHYKEPEKIHALRMLGESAAATSKPAAPASRVERNAPANQSLDHLFAAPATETKNSGGGQPSSEAPAEEDEDEDSPSWT